ncbi:MAG: PilN domain-containing protein [Planctomycetota bacterium]|nr:PilN domain-containing protein [Planctomycetota bacterium]
MSEPTNAAPGGAFPGATVAGGPGGGMPRATLKSSFLPADYVARKSEQRATMLGLGLFGLVMLGVVGAFLVTNRAWTSVREERLAVDKLYAEEAGKIEQLKELEQQRAQMMEKAEVTAALIENVPRSVLLGELVLRLPEDVKLTNMDLKGTRIETRVQAPPPGAAPMQVKSLADTKSKAAETKPKIQAPRFQHTLLMQGVASNNNDIADYVASLRACPLLQGVELNYIREATIQDRSLRQFEIQAEIRQDADGRALAAGLTQRLQESTEKAIADATSNITLRASGKGDPASNAAPASTHAAQPAPQDSGDNR